MNSFPGVPIRIRGQMFGDLYLTEKLGGAQFDAEDESILTTLAVAAGMAIDNARLYERSQQREPWLQVTAEVTNSLLSGSPRGEVLALIADRWCGRGAHPFSALFPYGYGRVACSAE